MRVLRLGHNCTRQNGAVRLSPARIKATNMFSFLFHREASPVCLPPCAGTFYRLNLVRKEVFTVALYVLFIHKIFSYDAVFNPSHRRRLQWLPGVWREKEISCIARLVEVLILKKVPGLCFNLLDFAGTHLAADLRAHVETACLFRSTKGRPETR